jgi:hypothetical protein
MGELRLENSAIAFAIKCSSFISSPPLPTVLMSPPTCEPTVSFDSWALMMRPAEKK